MALPIILPLAVGALVLVGCAKVASDVRKTRPLATLAGSEWGPVDPGAAEQFLAFKAGGEVIGHGGCNRFFGQYTQNGQTLAFGALASTKKYCGDIMQAETQFLQKLQETRTFQATHLKLSLYDADGNELLALQRRDWD
jgi:putative lipoprotein